MDHAQTELAPRRIRSAHQGGFTFIEVTVALALLAVAASILIGMQGAAVRRTIRDANAQTAMLVARRIMASVELLRDSEFSLATQSNGPVSDLLQQLNISGLGERAESAAIAQMTASVAVDEVDLEWTVQPKKETMKRVTLRLTWGPGPDETMQLVYQRAPIP